MPNTSRDTSQDEHVIPLLTYADEHLDEWCNLITDDARGLTRVVDWMVRSKLSPFGWSPEGKKAGTQQRSYILEWAVPGGEWARDVRAPAVTTRDGQRVGRIKLRLTRAELKRLEEQTP